MSSDKGFKEVCLDAYCNGAHVCKNCIYDAEWCRFNGLSVRKIKKLIKKAEGK